MIDSIGVKRSFINFPVAVKYAIGERVHVETEFGYIIGIKLGRFEWDYLIVIGDPPVSDSKSKWVHQHQIS